MENRIHYLAVLVQIVAVVKREISIVYADIIRVERLSGDDLWMADDVLQFVGDKTTTNLGVPTLFPMLGFQFGMSF